MNDQELQQQYTLFNQRVTELRQRAESFTQSPGKAAVEQAKPAAMLVESLEELAIAEEELRQQSEELQVTRDLLEVQRDHYREIFDSALDAYVITDPHGMIRDANRAAAALLKRQQQTLTGTPLAAYVAPAHWRTFRNTLDLLNAGKWDVRRSIPIAVVRRAGDVLEVELRASLIERMDGREGRVWWVWRDVAERKRMEERIQSTARFPAENPNPILRLGAGGRILYANEAARAILQRPGVMGDVTGDVTGDITGDDAGQPWRGLAEEALARSTRMTVDREQGDRTYTFTVVPVAEAGYVNFYGVDITERKRAEQALRRQAALLDLSPDAIIVRHLDGTITFWSRGAEALYGWSSQQAIGRVTHDLLQTRHPQPLDEIVRELRQSGHWAGELIHRAKDGREVIVQSIWQAQFDEHGEVSELLESNMDITARKRAEEALEGTLARTRELYEVSRRIGSVASPAEALHVLLESEGAWQCVSAAITVFDRPWAAGADPPRTATVVAHWQAGGGPSLVGQRFPTEVAWLSRVRLSQGPVYSQDVLTDPDASEWVRRYMRAAGIQRVAAFPLIANGQWYGLLTFDFHHPHQISLEALHHLGGLADQAAVAVYNLLLLENERQARREAEQANERVTRLKRAADALSSTLRLRETVDILLRQAVEASSASAGAVAVLSADGKTLQTVGALGYPEQMMTPWEHYPVDLPTSPTAAAVRQNRPLWFASAAERMASFPFTPDKPIDTTHRAWAAIPLAMNERVVGVLGLGYDMEHPFSEEERSFLLALAYQCALAVEQARLYEAEIVARREAERANELRLRFLGMISHELRTPLQSIKGFASTLLAEDVAWEPAQQRDFLQIIDREADKLTDMVDQLLDLSRIEAGTLRVDPAPQPLTGILSAVQQQFLLAAGQHPLTVEVAEGLPLVRADRQRITQVLTNLVDNAAKYSPGGLPITIRADHQGNEVWVSVSDHGPGIAPEDRLHVFEAFRRGSDHTARQTKGAGLGLAICKGIVEAHGGRLWIEEHEGPSLTMSFTLPIA